MSIQKQILIDLIVEDLCLQKLIGGIEAVGFTYNYEPRLHKSIAALMGATSQASFENWYDQYCYIYDKALRIDYNNKKELTALAENCVKQLFLLDISETEKEQLSGD